MTLNTLGRGNNLQLSIATAALTQVNNNLGDTNALITGDTPKGVLGGSIAGIRGDGIAGAADKTHRPIGWILNNAQGDPFDNSPAVASEKLPFHVNPNGLIKIDIYELNLQGTATPLVYAVDDKLYCSRNGFATNETPTGGNAVGTEIVGYVTSVPTSTDLFMTLQSKL